MNQQILAFFPYLCKEKNNDNIKFKAYKTSIFSCRFALPDGSAYQFICPGTEC